MPKIMYMDKKYSGSSFGNLEEYSEDILYEPLSAPVLINKWAEPLDLGILKEDLADYQFLECNFSGDSQNPCPNIINVSSLMYKDYMLVNLTAENNSNTHAFYLHFVDNSLNVYISTGITGYIWYVKGIKIGNSNIIPNPASPYTDTLSKLQINDKVYNLAVPAVNYSTDEQVIGTWIDGKPLYCRTFNSTSAADFTTSAILADTGNDTIIRSFEGLIDGKRPLNGYSGADDSYTWVASDLHRLGNFAKGASASKPSIVTVKYTKTTD